MFCVACLYWFYIQKRALPPDWRSLSVMVLYTKESLPSRLVQLVCNGFLYKREPSLQIGGLSVWCDLSVLVLYTTESLPSRLEASLFCVACR